MGLLCAQELPYLRPSMTEVTKMLRQKDVAMPVPSKPPFTDDCLELSQHVGSSWQPQCSDVSDPSVPLNFGHENV